MASVKKNKLPFKFEHEGEDYEIPSLARIKVGVIETMSDLPEGKQIFALFREIAPPEALEAIRDMEQEEFVIFTEKWQKHSGVNLGE